jgi:hypothetical protein
MPCLCSCDATGVVAFAGIWLWVGDGMRLLGPAVIVVAVGGLWVLSLVSPSDE